LTRPAGPAEVWREQAFELAEEGAWVSGRMDRVVVERDAAGRAVSATVIDFKSDRMEGDGTADSIASRYAPQVSWYVKALVRVLDLPEGQIRSLLLLTQTGTVVGVKA
jgi:ATP-dependent exoDNAse (exonuclease V) beta subunit